MASVAATVALALAAGLRGARACGPAGGVEAAAAEWDRPSFCREGDCPRFEKLPAGDGYEARRYPATEWVSTAEGQRSGFMSLFGYISGDNAEDRRIPMTSPVLMTSYPGAEGAEDRMSFWIEGQDQPGPAASEEGITVEEWPEMDVFVVSYGGWSSSEREERYADRLKEMLERDGREYNDSVVIAAGYNSPMTFFGRHNEVWLLKLDDGPAAGAATAGSGEEPSTSASRIEVDFANATLLDELTGGAPNATLGQ